MLDRTKPITSGDISTLTAELRAVTEEKETLQRQAAQSTVKLSAKQKAELDEKIQSLEDTASSLEKDLAYAVDYVNKNGSEYGIYQSEKAQPLCVCLGTAYGYAVFKRQDGAFFFEEENGQSKADICADCEALTSLDELTDDERKMILRHIFED